MAATMAALIRYIFLSTLSLRRATCKLQLFSIRHRYFYPHSPCGERPKAQDEYKDTVTISIHTLLAESDKARPPVGSLVLFISIHTLLAESDLLPRCGTARDTYFYPHSPCGERRVWPYQRYFAPDISIHTLLAESDRATAPAPITAKIFLSTLSLRRATVR